MAVPPGGVHQPPVDAGEGKPCLLPEDDAVNVRPEEEGLAAGAPLSPSDLTVHPGDVLKARRLQPDVP